MLYEDRGEGKFAGANLRGIKIPPGSDLSEINFNYADLSGANMSSSNFSRSSFQSADLSGANLYDAIFSDANMFHANLQGADLGAVSFDYTNLMGANLFDTNLSGARFTMAIKLKDAIMPDGSRHLCPQCEGLQHWAVGCEI